MCSIDRGENGRVKHSVEFLRVRDAILALEHDRDRARLAALFGSMTVDHRPLGQLRRVLRMICELDDSDLDRLTRWFSKWVNRWGQMPQAAGLQIDPRANRSFPDVARRDKDSR